MNTTTADSMFPPMPASQKAAPADSMFPASPDLFPAVPPPAAAAPAEPADSMFPAMATSASDSMFPQATGATRAPGRHASTCAPGARHTAGPSGRKLLDVLVPAIIEAANGTFESQGATLKEMRTPTPDTLDTLHVSAMIGFANDHLRGSVSVMAKHEVVQQLVPAELEGIDITNALLRDVLGECANMIVGRLKIALARRNIDFLMSTPITAIIVEISMPESAFSKTSWHTFATEKGDIQVRLEVATTAAFAMRTEAPAQGPAEGDLLMF